ncbi:MULTISPECIES: DUF3040 domain-containing protein [Actinosynnema]|uniref:DUF3040 domain-containing protein n=1 Tax=Actinosynnema TaxID=40566 RepID=UPI0020A25D19|nr:DUF3040 domain-containing protein [Actinosynnema pretiosum]MCP2095520.1 Protein of unknown function (DUF3040) [Actinosynnema pretiosum]
MLSERERKTLQEIESRLAGEEPALASALVDGKPTRPTVGYALTAAFLALGIVLMTLGAFWDGVGSISFGLVVLLFSHTTWK